MFNQSPAARANITASLRGCVCLYLGYLGVSVIRGAASPDTTMPLWLAWVFGVILVLAAAAFGVYTLNRWQLDKAAAALEQGRDEPAGEKEQKEQTEETEAEEGKRENGDP